MPWGLALIAMQVKDMKWQCSNCKGEGTGIYARCDFLIGEQTGALCRMPLCHNCAVVVGWDRHHCPMHQEGA